MVQDFHQTIRHSAVGAHHQNGVAERAISTIMSISRAMLHHSALHWPDVADVGLWPLAVLHAVRIWNRMPNEQSGRSPLELFSRTTFKPTNFQDFHVWGCPVYVLNSTLSDGKKLPRWQPRSGRHVYVGQSRDHHRSIPLVLSLDSGNISPQYHVVFDDWFSTVSTDLPETIDFDHDDWYRTFGLSHFQYIPDDTVDPPIVDSHDTLPPAPPELLDTDLVGGAWGPDLDQPRHSSMPPYAKIPPPGPEATLDSVESPPAQLAVQPSPQREKTAMSPVAASPVAPSQPLAATKSPDWFRTLGLSPTRPKFEPRRPAPISTMPSSSPPPVVPSTPRSPVSTQREQQPIQREPQTVQREQTPIQRERTPVATPRRQSFAPPPTPRVLPTPTAPTPPTPATSARPATRSQKKQTEKLPPVPERQSVRIRERASRGLSSAHAMMTQLPHELQPLLSFWVQLAMAHTVKAKSKSKPKSQTDPDTLNYDQAMRSELRDGFIEASDEEVGSLEEQGTWIEVPKSEARDKILPSQWVYRIKRNPDGRVKKLKARLVLRGDLQEHDGDTYSPVASWMTVRIFLLISAMMRWITCTIDFSNAFVQSYLPEDEPVWMHPPRGYRTQGGSDYCLKLIKSLYGDVRAPMLWYQFISDHFTRLGFKQSHFDKCLWYRKDIMLVQYVDDIGIAATSQEVIDQFVADLRKEGLALTQEESFAEFLGIKFDNKPDGSINMTQKGLIQKVLETAKMTDCNPNATPTLATALGADKDGKPMTESWNYRAVIGMLLYLSTNTRPDISFAVSQVARFSAAPKHSHASAVKMILRYLKKTQDKGTLVHPSDKLRLDLYVDADFAGLFKREADDDSNSVRSRTGYVILLSGWPIVWKSQLQTHLSQSTLEAEYSALSHSLKTLLPLKWQTEEIISNINSVDLEHTKIHATVFEDNQSAYFLATNQRITSRTKYFLVKWHWFWDKYNEGHFTVVKCPTDEQLADFLTKPLSRDKFQTNRQGVIGW